MIQTLAVREQRLHGLMVGAQAGNARAYEEFLREVAAVLRAFFRRRLVRWPDEVEDLVQETLLAVHNKRHTYQPRQPITPWLHAIARYKLIDLWRSRAGRESLREVFDESEEEFAAVDEAEARDARRDLRRLLAGLPDKQRLPIEYVKIEGLSVDQAARLTGLSASAVKVGVHRGLRVLAARVRGQR